jgi:hypothetical protein
MRRPVLRCGNAGWSGWIDEFGYIRHVAMNGDGDIYYRGANDSVPVGALALAAQRLGESAH